MNPDQPPSASQSAAILNARVPTSALSTLAWSAVAILLSFFVFTQFGVVPGYPGTIRDCFDEK